MTIAARDLNKAAIQRIGANSVHKYNKGTGVRIGIVSDGIMPHPAYQGKIKGGWDFVNNTALSDISGDNPSYHLSGTATAGLIAGSGVPFKASQVGGPADISILGVAPEAYLYDLRVGKWNEVTTATRVASAITWAIDNKLEVLVLQVGWLGKSYQDITDAVTKAYDANIIMFAPVGANIYQYQNTLSDWPLTIPPANFPANLANVIGVGVISHTNDKPDYFGHLWIPGVSLDIWGPTKVRYYHARDGNTELVAPGGLDINLAGGVGSTYGIDGTTTQIGTWISAAMAAGVAALIISSGRETTVGGIRQRLRDTTTKLSSAGLESVTQLIYGYGLVNAVLAAPPPSVAGTVEELKTTLKIGATGLGDTNTINTLASIPPRITVKQDPAPYLSRYPSPRDGETNVPLSNPIRFTLKSDTVGIDITTLKVAVKGETFKYGDKEITFTGNRKAYDVGILLPYSWGEEETVDVDIQVEDFSGNPGLVYERILN